MDDKRAMQRRERTRREIPRASARSEMANEPTTSRNENTLLMQNLKDPQRGVYRVIVM